MFSKSKKIQSQKNTSQNILSQKKHLHPIKCSTGMSFVIEGGFSPVGRVHKSFLDPFGSFWGLFYPIIRPQG